MDFKPRPQRKSIRLKGYDYSRAGLYFVTICCHDRACLFGEISTNPVGADLCVRPDDVLNVRPDDNMYDDMNVHPDDNLYVYSDDNSYDHPDNKTKFDTWRTNSINDGQTQSMGGQTHRFAPTGLTDELGSTTTPQMILNDAGRMVEKWYYELENKFPDIKCHEMVVMPNHIHCIIQNIGFIPSVKPVGADLCVRPCDNIHNRPCDNIHNRPCDNIHNRPCDNIHNRPDDNTNIRPIDNMDIRQDDTDESNPITIGENSPLQTGVHSQSPTTEHSQTEPGEHSQTEPGEHFQTEPGEHIGSPLRAVVQWWKTMTTNEYIRGVKTSDWEPFFGKLWQRNYYEHIIRNEQSYDVICEYIRNNPEKWHDDKFCYK